MVFCQVLLIPEARMRSWPFRKSSIRKSPTACGPLVLAQLSRQASIISAVRSKNREGDPRKRGEQVDSQEPRTAAQIKHSQGRLSFERNQS